MTLDRTALKSRIERRLAEMSGAALTALPPEYRKSHGGFSYASTQVNLPARLAALTRRTAAYLDAEDVLKAEETPHVTVKYGIESDEDAGKLATLLAEREPFLMTFDIVDCFPAVQTGAEEDVVIVRVDSAGLDALHNDIGRELDVVHTFPYNPHVTLAYVKAGTGMKYRAMDNPLTGQQQLVTAIMFSNRAGVLTRIPLRGDEHYPRESA